MKIIMVISTIIILFLAMIPSASGFSMDFTMDPSSPLVGLPFNVTVFIDDIPTENIIVKFFEYAGMPGNPNDDILLDQKYTNESGMVEFIAPFIYDEYGGYYRVEAKKGVTTVSKSFNLHFPPSDNDRPTSDAGGPYSAGVDEIITFDGSGSTDTDGTITGYRWDFDNDGTYETDWLTQTTTSHSYSSEGSYTVKLQVKDDGELADTDTAPVTIVEDNNPPVADAGGPYSAEEEEYITFDGSGSTDTDGTITGYRWDFDNDGTYETDWKTQATTYYSYSGPGSYVVKLQVKDNYDAIDTDTASVAIIDDNTPPLADAGGPYSAEVYQSITFDGSGSIDTDGTIIGYRWDWTNDGTYDTGWLTSSSTTHSYSSEGSYTVKLQVKDNDDSTDTDTAIVTILGDSQDNTPPTADAGGPYYSTTGTITLDATGSSDSDGTITGYRWDLENDGFGEYQMYSSSPTLTWSFTSGSYTINLEVIDNDGATDTDTTTVTISEDGQENIPPIADAAGPYSAGVNESIMFDGSGSSDSDGAIVGYRWDWTNDGIYDTDWLSSSSVTYNYSSAGYYTVKLQVKDNYGSTNTDITTATISAEDEENIPPVADAGGPYSAVIGEEIWFEDYNCSDIDGMIIYYNWDFGDGSTYTGADPMHTYNSAGNFTITLEIMDDKKAFVNDTTYIIVSGDNSKTPGFEMLFAIISIAIFLFLNRRRIIP